MDRPTPTPATETLLLGGRLRFRQTDVGYRAGMDAALLAAACDAPAGARVVDLGCGAGAVMLSAALRRPGARFVGVERDPEALLLASANIGLNGLQDRVKAVAGDVAEPWTRLGEAPFDAALCNPPYFDDPGALRGPAPEKKGAWLADHGLAAWTLWMGKAVRSGGTLTWIHRADRLADLLGLLSGKAGSFQIRPVQPFADAPAKRVIVRAIQAGRAPLVLLPALVLHPRDGARHTKEAEAILRGEAALAWL